MTVEVLQIGPLMKHVQETLERDYRVHRYWQAKDKDALIAEIAPRVRAIATDGASGASRAVMERLPALEIVVCQGVGYDAIDIGYAAERGVKVTNTPGVLNDAVANLTLGLMLSLCRRLPQCDRYLREGRWKAEGSHPLTAELTGAKVGILGLGRIGKEIARRCEAFKMEVAYHGRHEQADQPYRYYADLVEMAAAVDWLVVIAPGSPETTRIVNRAVMEALGPEGSLVNVARGTLVDEPVLVELLQAGKLGGAALDVFEDEPNVPEPLLAMENVVLLPHCGSATHKTRRAMGDLVLDNLAAHLAGRPLLTPVV